MSSLESQIPFTTSEESFLEGLEPVPTSEVDFLPDQNVFPSFSTTTTATTTTPTTSTTALLMQFVNGSAFAESINGSQKIDLQTLWKWLEQGGQTLNAAGNGHNVSGNGGSTIAGVVGLNEANLHAIDAKNTATTWQLAIIQGVLLAMLVILSILWAFCCRRMRRGDAPLLSGITEQVVAMARKISNGSSRDLPPSYSKVDLTQVGLTINDHFNPPPHYDVVNEEEVTGDTRRHRRRVSRFSLSSLEAEAGLSLPPNRRLTDRFSIESDRPARFSVSSETGSESSGIIRSSRFSTSSSASGCSCGTDSEASSRRTSRVTFAPNLESGPTRRESSQSLPLQPVLVKSRKSSAQSEGSAESRRVSFIDELTGKSARPDPLLEEKLRTQLEIVKEAGEMGEFITASAKSSASGASEAPLPLSSTTTPSSSTASSLAASASSLSSASSSSGAASSSSSTSASTSASTSSIASADDKSSKNDHKKDLNPNPEKKLKKKSFCHLPEDDIKNKELFI